MASTIAFQYQPSDAAQTSRGVPVSATLRRILYGIECVVSGADTRTQPITRTGISRATLYVEGVPGDSFAIEICYKPAFLPASTPGVPPPIDVSTSKWVTIGSTVIPALPFKPVVKQTFEDLGYCFRVTRTSGAGNFSVFVWAID